MENEIDKENNYFIKDQIKIISEYFMLEELLSYYSKRNAIRKDKQFYILK